MQELLRWIASLQGIQVDDAEMQFEFASFPGGGLGLLVLALLALLVVFVGWAAVLDRARARQGSGEPMSVDALAQAAK